MKIYGKIHEVSRKERIIGLVIRDRLCYFHMTNKDMKDFKAYFTYKPYVCFEINDKRIRVNGLMCYEITHFTKIVVPQIKKTNIFYDLEKIRDSVRTLLDKKNYKMFLDLEFSLPSGSFTHVPEILQYGMIVEDPNGNILFEDFALVKPLKKNALSPRTLRFLSLEYEEFEEATPYIALYQLIEKWIDEYDVKIVAWGKNDIIALEHSFKMNHVMPLDIRNRYLNLMQIMKNYYNYRQEMGLFNTYQEMTQTEAVTQNHNALVDAKIARDIYHLFRAQIYKK